MKRRLVLCTLFSLFLLPRAKSAVGGSPQVVTPSRSFYFKYEVTIKDIPRGAKLVRIWIPVASPDAQQSVVISKISAVVPVRLEHSTASGNRILYAEILQPRTPAVKFEIVYKVIRKEYSEGSYASLMRYNHDRAPWSPVLERFLQPDRLIPTSGTIKRIGDAVTRGKQGEIAKVYALYDYVFHTMRYDKSGTGWGRGDAMWACDAHHGNCTDFHSLFIALARSENIPARFFIGFPLPPNSSQGSVSGYHCWAAFYVPGLGWVPVDISEAWLTPALHGFYFGSLDANRVLFSVGRDLMLTPKQSGPPVNYFIYPYVEVDGRPLTSIDKKFSFQDVSVSRSTPLRAAAGSRQRRAGPHPATGP